ncbi:SEL1-like repeat protein [Corallincola spongiicola]|uniref:Sel1 repeat family protein n=1 Tax=Corallincola spongiicola TaxID=2520508 RepID=A0ABY1WRP1_9GAMM|nr:SEL1-like repeat protein [Corallincola spongiicola]TAA47263.1 hypothetical protein EXY25_08490 [Corallincola spongiicola]
MNDKDREKIEEFYDREEIDELYIFLKSHIEKEEPYALYIYSSFSLPIWNETDEEFDERRIRLLKKSSSLGCPEAMYQLACCYLYGEGIERDVSKCIECATQAANLGYKYAETLLEQLVRNKE